ncbi:hypothetical protein ACRAWD_24365 [Caulobacter segnis]
MACSREHATEVKEGAQAAASDITGRRPHHRQRPRRQGSGRGDQRKAPRRRPARSPTRPRNWAPRPARKPRKPAAT